MKLTAKLIIILLAIMLTASVMPANVIAACMSNRGAWVTIEAPDGEYTIVSAYDGSNRVNFTVSGGYGGVLVKMEGWVLILDRNGTNLLDALVGIAYLEDLPLCGRPTFVCPPDLPPFLDCPHGGVE
jgi:hypothetical protein